MTKSKSKTGNNSIANPIANTEVEVISSRQRPKYTGATLRFADLVKYMISSLCQEANGPILASKLFEMASNFGGPENLRPQVSEALDQLVANGELYAFILKRRLKGKDGKRHRVTLGQYLILTDEIAAIQANSGVIKLRDRIAV